MIEHMKVHEPIRIKKFKCAVCDKDFLSKTGLRQHLETIHAYELHGEHKCHCGKVFNTFLKLKTHKNYVHDANQKECKECSKTFKNGASLRTHKFLKHGKKVPCEICKRMIREGFFMSEHLKTHQPPTFKCKFKRCSKLFHKKLLLSQHYRMHHTKKAKCKECDVTFTSVFHLKNHLKVQHGEKKFKCEIEGCDYKAVRSDYIKKHYKCHKKLTKKQERNL